MNLISDSTCILVQIRHRGSADKTTEDGTKPPEWQTDNWRKNQRWPPTQGDETPPAPSGGLREGRPPLKNSSSSTNLVPPPPMPAPPEDPQEDLSKVGFPMAPHYKRIRNVLKIAWISPHFCEKYSLFFLAEIYSLISLFSSLFVVGIPTRPYDGQ